MKNSTPLLLLLLVVFISSCTMNSDVVADRGIQKRKYRKGFFVDLGKKNPAQQVVAISTKAEAPEKMEVAAVADPIENVRTSSPESLRKINKSLEQISAPKNAVLETESQTAMVHESEADVKVEPVKRGNKAEISAFAGLAVPAAASMVRSDNSLLKQGLILILIGLILQLIGGFSGLLVWIGSVIALVGLIFILVYLIRAL